MLILQVRLPVTARLLDDDHDESRRDPTGVSATVIDVKCRRSDRIDSDTVENVTPAANAPRPFDLVVVGASAGGLSVVVSSLRSGLARVRLLATDDGVAFPDLIEPNQIDVGYGETITSIDSSDGSMVTVTTDRHEYITRAVLVADRHDDADWQPEIATPTSDRIHIGGVDLPPSIHDVCVVGTTDHAVELTVRYSMAGHHVVLAASGMDPSRLSPAGAATIRRLERERAATILYRSTPKVIDMIDGLPLIEFADRHTPDLVFDAVVFAPPRRAPAAGDLGITDRALDAGRVWFIGEPGSSGAATVAPGSDIGIELAKACFPEIDISRLPSPRARRSRHATVIDDLRTEHYNATITQFDPHHSDLWVLRVRPDSGATSFEPGQYASLGLGYWEDRIDEAADPEGDERWDRLIRRSYSISSRMFDEFGYLADDTTAGELEFYIVLVRPTPERIPALTPRLALKRPGDRIYLGPKVAGRYTTSAIKDPHAEVVFLSTGTGEAPHNAMVVELLRKGHTGPIVSAVSVRNRTDLGYLRKHEQLAARFPNYHYLAMPTRETDTPKRYLQDLINDGDLERSFGLAMTPATTHVYLCGNPAMIGLPEVAADGSAEFPRPTGVVELLVARGFTIDRRGAHGTIHYEEYW